MDIEDAQHSSPSSSSSSSCKIVYKKRPAGRKKFKETRHPVYRGVRQKEGKWVCEVREPKKKSRLWLGTFPNPEMAAVAHDVAALTLRGDNAQLNFPYVSHCLPRPVSSSHQDVRKAALRAARSLIRPAALSFDVIGNPISSPSSSSVDMENANKNGKTPSSMLDISSSSDLFDLKNIKQNTIVEIPSSGGEHDIHGDVGFVDEEAIFNMPLLLDSMAEGMLLTPIAMKKGFNWSNVEDDHEIDFTLWGD